MDESVQFSADVSTDLQTGGCATVSELTYEWNFDAETDTDDADDTGDGESPFYTYTSPGEKTVTLNVTEVVEGDEEPVTGSASTTLAVEKPQISISATPETGAPPQTISFSMNPVISGKSTEWRIDGALVSTNQSFEHTFRSAGTYDVNVTVGFGGNDSHSATKTVRIGEPTNWYDKDRDGTIEIDELGTAAADYAIGRLSIAELGEIAAIYARS